MVPLDGVASMALRSRLTKTWRSLVGLPLQVISERRDLSTFRWAAFRSHERSWRVSSMILSGEKAVSPARSGRAMLSSSAAICRARLVFASMVSRADDAWGLSPADRWASWVQPRSAVRMLLNSWATPAATWPMVAWRWSCSIRSWEMGERAASVRCTTTAVSPPSFTAAKALICETFASERLEISSSTGCSVSQRRFSRASACARSPGSGTAISSISAMSRGTVPRISIADGEMFWSERWGEKTAMGRSTNFMRVSMTGIWDDDLIMERVKYFTEDVKSRVLCKSLSNYDYTSIPAPSSSKNRPLGPAKGGTPRCERHAPKI